MRFKFTLFPLTVCALLINACDSRSEPMANRKEALSSPVPVTIKKTGNLRSSMLNEVSGMQSSLSTDGHFFVHNDEGEPIIYVIDETGTQLGSVMIESAKNKDWEDITSVPVEQGHWLVAGEIGDNSAKRKSIMLYFIAEPQPDAEGHYSGTATLEHKLKLRYPDGPRDSESLSYDPIGQQILILSKRDVPARLYGIDLESALKKPEAQLTFLGSIYPFRPPTVSDRATWGGRVEWISQPTGLDISADGNEAVVITYRSLYRFDRQADEDWISALQRKPDELVGPPAPQNESVTYSSDNQSIYVASEKKAAPIYRIQFNREE